MHNILFVSFSVVSLHRLVINCKTLFSIIGGGPFLVPILHDGKAKAHDDK